MTLLPTPPDLRALTTLRFFAALWVVLFAAWPHLDVAFTPNVVAKGYLGVETFFILSGFILSHVYLEASGTKRFSYGGFLWARIARVYPLHLATLFGMIGLGLAASVVGITVDASLLDWRSLPAHLTMTQAWGLAPGAAFNHPSWSISAEWFAYLAFPVFAFVAWRLRERPVLATVLAAAFALAVYAAFQPLAGFSLTQATFRWGALRIAPCFALGCALYLVHRRRTLPYARSFAVVSAVGMAVSTSMLWWDPIAVLFAGGLILSLGSIANEKGGLFASKPGVYLGEISYAVYMVHAAVLLIGFNLAARVTGGGDKLPFVVWLAVLAVIPLAAALAYHLIERPARKALRGMADRRAARKTAAIGRTEKSEGGLQPSETIS